MNRIRPLFAASIILALATLLPVAAFSAQEPSPTPDPSAAVVVEPEVTPAPESCIDPETASADCFPNATPTPDNCWDCEGTTMTEAERYAAACSAEMIQKNPSMLSTCFPKKWAWVCFPEDPILNIEGHCEMYRRDLDPLGIFATPAPMPTPEPLPTPAPTATPDPTRVPDPESPATVTP
jgi:hypothetical protein